MGGGGKQASGSSGRSEGDEISDPCHAGRFIKEEFLRFLGKGEI
jgi:hypothetical protein